METRGLSRAMNRRLGAHVRGVIVDALRHLAAKAGIAVVDVPARGTSSGCPGCGRTLKHVKSPDRLTDRGHKWSHCPPCGLTADRDRAAAQRIVGRGLLGQAHVKKTRAGTYRTVTTVDGPVRVVRDKTTTTPRRRPRSSSPTPSRRRVPAPTKVGQRPAGRPPQTHSTIVGQVPTTKPTSRHRPQGWRTGRGFHRHVTSSPCRSVPRPGLS
ncbi:zinc ribbon domain-containing protein [Actinoplanes derwentensis]|uniref:zinc ribbon domain-containing protein n=1 Tax=Actinoplanes derwentensis TaxID=113562 RepID=UPI000B85AD1B